MINPDRTPPSGRRTQLLGIATLAAALVGCAHGPPRIGGVAGAPASSNQLWTAPAEALVVKTLPQAAIPADLAARVRQLALGDVVDLALRNNPVTRASW